MTDARRTANFTSEDVSNEKDTHIDGDTWCTMECDDADNVGKYTTKFYQVIHHSVILTGKENCHTKEIRLKLRHHYPLHKSGEMMPTKHGITLSIMSWKMLTRHLSHVLEWINEQKTEPEKPNSNPSYHIGNNMCVDVCPQLNCLKACGYTNIW